jgi:hypothetical protein
MKNDLIYIAIGAFLIGVIASTLTIYATHRHYYEITKTTIGEFIIHDGHIYSVYEMERNVRGEMVAK